MKRREILEKATELKEKILKEAFVDQTSYYIEDACLKAYNTLFLINPDTARIKKFVIDVPIELERIFNKKMESSKRVKENLGIEGLNSSWVDAANIFFKSTPRKKILPPIHSFLSPDGSTLDAYGFVSHIFHNVLSKIDYVEFSKGFSNEIVQNIGDFNQATKKTIKDAFIDGITYSIRDFFGDSSLTIDKFISQKGQWPKNSEPEYLLDYLKTVCVPSEIRELTDEEG